MAVLRVKGGLTVLDKKKKKTSRRRRSEEIGLETKMKLGKKKDKLLYLAVLTLK